METRSKSRPTGSLFIRFSQFLKALWIFFPGIIFLLLGLFIFLQLPQGKDIIYQSTDAKYSWVTGLYLVLAAIFYVFTTWYTARLIAYDRNDLYKEAPWVLFHFPRLLGYSIFLVLWLSVFLIDDVEHKRSGWFWPIILFDLFIYAVFHNFFERSITGVLAESRLRRLAIIRNIVRSLIGLACVLVIWKWNSRDVNILLITLPIFQFGFLFLVIVRHPLYRMKTAGRPGRNLASSKSRWDRYISWIFGDAFKDDDIHFEKPFFIIYHILAACALFCYLMSVNYLPFARGLTSFPLVLLSFGILLGIINFLALLSHRKRINFNFLLIAVILLSGLIFETHSVREIKATDPDKMVYGNRPGFRQYLESWIRWHQAELDADTTKPFPVFFTLADGGASRSGYWAASVLSTLHEGTKYNDGTNRSYFSDHLFCLSGASGGSVGNGVFLASYALQRQQQSLNVDTLSMNYLGNDFLVYPLAHILGPDLIQPIFGWVKSWGDRAAALEHGLDYPEEKNSDLARMIRGSFSQLIPNEQNRLPILSINTTRVNDGGPGVVSTIHVDSSNGIFGKRIDVLDLVEKGRDIRLSTAMILGARFPYMSPGGKLGINSYFVDGGYFDNSGAGPVHEMLLELNRIANDPAHTLQRIVKRFQFYVIHLSNTPYTRSKDDKAASIHPTLNDLATPLLTLAGSYNSQTSVNDARLINYLKELNKERNSYIIFNLYDPTKTENISMNWVISDRVRTKMDQRKREKPGLDELIRRLQAHRSDNLFQGLKILN